MIGSTIRSAKMNAITPAKLMPPDQSTAASGMLPIEQTKLSTAMTGPTSTFSIVVARAGRRSMNSDVEDVVAEQADEPASRNPMPISFHSICQSPRKLCATSDQA